MYNGIVMLQNQDGRWSVSWNVDSVPQALTFFDFEDIAKEVKSTRDDLTKRIDDLMKLLAQMGLTASASPRRLTEMGEKVLKDSGIDTIVDDKFDYIVKKVKAKNPENPYQAEQDVLSVVEDLSGDSTVRDAIERGAFNSGQIVSAVLFVGGIYIRDRVLQELGFDVNKIDDHTPQAP